MWYTCTLMCSVCYMQYICIVMCSVCYMQYICISCVTCSTHVLWCDTCSTHILWCVTCSTHLLWCVRCFIFFCRRDEEFSHHLPHDSTAHQRSLPPLPSDPHHDDENPYYSAVPVEPSIAHPHPAPKDEYSHYQRDGVYSFCQNEEGEYSQPCLPSDVPWYETAADSIQVRLSVHKQLPSVPVSYYWYWYCYWYFVNVCMDHSSLLTASLHSQRSPAMQWHVQGYTRIFLGFLRYVHV